MAGINKQGERNVPHSMSPPRLHGGREPSAGPVPALLQCDCPGARIQSGVWDKAMGEWGQETLWSVEEPLPP